MTLSKMIKVPLKRYYLPNFKLKEIIKIDFVQMIKVSRSFTLTHRDLQYNIK